MADGTTKPIEQVKTGDQVIATDPETGESRVETVTAEITGEGLKHLVKVTIDTDGDHGTETAQITATDGHPFWVPQLRQWIDATDLNTGQWLQTSAGTHVQITAITRRTSHSTTVHNLTISDLHTYHALAGATPVLVHNTCGRVFAVDSSGEATALPVHEIDSSAYPGVADNFTNALANGESPIVTRMTGRSAIRANRNAAQAGAPRPGILAAGMSWEEFPFASTYEGGSGATLRLIPRNENVAHGRDSLWPFLKDNGINGGDQYYVRRQ